VVGSGRLMEEHCPCAGETLDKFLQPAILALLSEGSLHGYKLMRRLSGMPMFREQSPDATGLYRCLKEMERRGLVTSTKAQSKKGPVVRLFHVTPLGCACLLRWTNTLEKHKRALGALQARARRATRKNQRAGLLGSAMAFCVQEGAKRHEPAGRTSAVSDLEMGRPAVADELGETLTFQMGLYKAAVPKRLLYSKLHFWFDFLEGGGTRCGLTAYAMRLASDVFRIEWRVEPGHKITEGQVLGEIESVKAIAELYAPMNGTLLKVNAGVVADPSQLSLEPYRAWLLEFSGKPDSSLQAAEYVQFLTDEWERTSKLFKGQS